VRDGIVDVEVVVVVVVVVGRQLVWMRQERISPTRPRRLLPPSDTLRLIQGCSNRSSQQ
jgi:hypothetical protein